MGFFSDLEPSDEDFREPEPRRVRWQGDIDDTAGVLVNLVPLKFQSDRVAIIASGFSAYPTGFTFSLVTISRLNPAPLPLGFHQPGMRGRSATTGGELRFGIAFADGSKVISAMHRPMPGREAMGRILRPRGGGGGGRMWSQEFWCEPLPPAGLMAFVCEWRDFDIPETSIEANATAILEAAAHAAPIWPEDVDLPEDPESSSRRSSGRWSSSSYGRMQAEKTNDKT